MASDLKTKLDTAADVLHWTQCIEPSSAYCSDVGHGKTAQRIADCVRAAESERTKRALRLLDAWEKHRASISKALLMEVSDEVLDAVDAALEEEEG